MSHWMCVSVTYKSVALEFKGNRATVIRTRKSLISALKPLIEGAASTPDMAEIAVALLSSKKVKIFEDSLTSPFFGQHTKRINIVYPAKVIIPYKSQIATKLEEITAVGKKMTVENCSFISDIRMQISVTDVDPADIDALLKRHPTWFIGDIGLAEEKPGKSQKKNGVIPPVATT